MGPRRQLRSFSIDAPSLGRAVDEFGQAPLPGCFLLGADDPPREDPPVGGCLGLKEVPGFFVRSERPFIRLAKRGFLALLIRVDGRFLVGALLEGLQAGGLHQAKPDQFLRSIDVDFAPNTARSPWRKSDSVPGAINILPYAVNPPETECCIHGFRPCDARLIRAFSMKPDQQLTRLSVMLLKPRAEVGRRREVQRFHRIPIE